MSLNCMFLLRVWLHGGQLAVVPSYVCLGAVWFYMFNNIRINYLDILFSSQSVVCNMTNMTQLQNNTLNFKFPVTVGKNCTT